MWEDLKKLFVDAFMTFGLIMAGTLTFLAYTGHIKFVGPVGNQMFCIW